MKANKSNLAGWLGLVMLQTNSLPLTLNAIEHVTISAATPSLTIVGLLLYMVRALTQRDLLYIVSNGVGIFLNAVLLFFILKG